MRSNSWFLTEIWNLTDFDKILIWVVKWSKKSAVVKKSPKNVKFWSFLAILGHIIVILGGSEGSNFKSFIRYPIWYSNWSSWWGCFRNTKTESFEVMWRHLRAIFDSFLAIFCFKRPLLGPAGFGTYFLIFLGKFDWFKITSAKKLRCGAMCSNSWFLVEIWN